MSSVLGMRICSGVSWKQNVIRPWHGNMRCSVKKTECRQSLLWKYVVQCQENRMSSVLVMEICSAVSRKQNVVSTWHENMQWSVMKTKCHQALAWEYAVQCQENRMSSVLVMEICSAVSRKQNVVSPCYGNM